ncbi:hypothetical protein [Rhizobium leguminosarum]|uniref:hypothetical protein n=1 Tax=Rhizobium leguminosarum TaxID=384 RepID=UPI001030B143|nr:hypothetical protein [Rhizobium leguminosarum]NEI66520.1 hypothetical protein [Rhizobium leguminosarum]TBF89154.1 hypothetical protein ELG82_37045 [Rhizobium leguminosarum]
MFKFTPEKVIKLGDHSSPEANEAFRLIRNDLHFKLENRDAQPTEDDYREAADFLTDATGIVLGIDAVKALLTLYPETRIDLATDDRETEYVGDRLKDVVADAFLNCRWPTDDDNVDVPAFITVLHTQAEAAGYATLSMPIPPPNSFPIH